LDLHNFKNVNDTCGHAVGDDILRSVGRASVEAIRGSDVSCRIGGDEFAILLPGAERSSTEALAERMARRFETYANAIAPTCRVEIDYGIAIFPQDGEDATSLFRSADKDLYGNKQRTTRREEGLAPSPRASGTEVQELVPEVGAAADGGALDRSAGVVSSSEAEQAGEETQSADHARERRRYERIPVEGARRLGLVRLQEKSKAVKVLDVSVGGVCLLTDDYDLPDSFTARIQASFLPDAELTLHRIYSFQLPDGKKRVGCSFSPARTA
jgi:diguanylate cyclase (GGDEF)-like protein